MEKSVYFELELYTYYFLGMVYILSVFHISWEVIAYTLHKLCK